MPIDVSVHNPAYDKWMVRWAAIDDAVEGLHRVLEKDQKYLPPLSGMLDDSRQPGSSYERYKLSARWYSAANRTISLLIGLISRRPITMLIDDRFNTEIKENINGRNVSISGLITNICKEMLLYSRACIKVDFVESIDLPGAGRPVIDNIPIKNIINWREKNDEFELLVIEKSVLLPDEKNPYESVLKCLFCVYSLEEGRAYYETFTESVSGPPVTNNDKKLLTLNGKPLSFIPVRFVSLIEDDKFLITSPPLEPIVDHCYNFFRISADRGWGLHHVALPTPYFTGVNKNQLPQGLGPSIIVGLPTGATAGMLSYSGEGLNELLNEMKEIKLEIADLGARLIESRGRAQEAEGTVEMKMIADSSSLSAVVEQVSDALTWAIRLYHEYRLSSSEDRLIDINTDFIRSKLKGSDLTALVDAYIKGAIPIEVFFENLKEGEIVNQDTTVEQFTLQLFDTQRRQLDEALNVSNQVVPQDDDNTVI